MHFRLAAKTLSKANVQPHSQKHLQRKYTNNKTNHTITEFAPEEISRFENLQIKSFYLYTFF